MTLHAQRRWVAQEIARNQRLLAETMVLGATILAKAREDLAVLEALAMTLRVVEPPLFRATTGEQEAVRKRLSRKVEETR